MSGFPMLARVDLRGSADVRAALARPPVAADDVSTAVAAIVADVRARGDAALRDCTERFDGFRPEALAVAHEELDAAVGRIEPELRKALELAHAQILAWHEVQAGEPIEHRRAGVRVRELLVPMQRAGCYVPGGRAPLASSVLMTAVPARVAGVADVALCTPPQRDGSVHDAILAAARLAGVDAVYRVGGAQAIAALAYGTESIAAVDVIVGPGSAYVAEAKRQVAADVAIDGYAGPSEVAIVADDSVAPVLVAADLLAQAEHGPGGACALITWSDSQGAAVERELRALLDRARVATPETEATLRAGGRLVLVEGPEQAIAAADAIAPEHLELMCAGAEELVPLVHNAGAVFVGSDASAVIGDYVAGVNHVLPTGGTARFADALRVDDFRKHLHVVSVDEGALADLAPAVTTLAEAEGLLAHADALRLREQS
jgi:histidinol dehydrogenase